MKDLLAIDFEYNHSSERHPNLVSAAWQTVYPPYSQNIWLYKDNAAQKRLKTLFEAYKDFIILSYNVEAEARSFMSLGLDPSDFQWVDLWVEYKMLLNKNNNLAYGRQLIDGRVKFTRPPKLKYVMTEQDIKKASFDKPQDGLSACVFKLIGELIDTKEKEEVREIIISDVNIEKNKERILKYNLSDIKYLSQIYNMIHHHHRKLDPSNETLLDEMLLRGRYAVASAKMVSEGYPVEVDSVRAFSDNVKNILSECQRDINSQFPEIEPFGWVPKELRYKENQANIRKWVEETQEVEKWLKTDTGKSSLSLEAFTQHFIYRHEYPRGNFGAQMVRYLKLKQNLNGFSIGQKKKTIWDFLGSDNRVRPYFNIFRAQSSRSQPSSTSFIFLKSAWMRSMVQPERGKVIVAIDYKSQEFLINALEYQDHNAIEAYFSGDVYFYFAKKAGAVPPDAKREEYEEIRNLFKSTVLGIQYGMRAESLAEKLTADTGRKVTEEEAQELIDMYEEVFADATEGKEETLERYYEDKYLKLPCGWYMWGDNDNSLSTKNARIQGMGASIMRRSVILAQSRGVKIIKTLHDALYAEFSVTEKDIPDVLALSMKEAFKYFYLGTPMEKYADIKLDMVMWSPSFSGTGESVTPGGNKYKYMDYYVDSRATAEYEQFKKYLVRSSDLDNV